jgi:hypothetical protein
MRKTIEQFIKEAKEIHGETYLYNNTIYTTAHNKCIITCKIHGDFQQTPNSHITKKFGCKKCGRNRCSDIQKIGLEEFIKRANIKHNGKYDYSLITNYKNNSELVEIICPNNHIFKQSPYEHTIGSGCSKCIGYFKTNSDIIKEFKEAHGDKYIYNKVNYMDSRTLVIITCKIHGDFKQNPYDHSVGHGCSKCNTLGKVMEPKLYKKIKDTFKNNKVISNYNPNWLGKQSLDIYIEDYNIAIEYQGIQHFKPTQFFGGKKSFFIQENNDTRKRKLCEENGCKLFYFTYKKNHIPKEYEHKVYSSEEDLINAINNKTR